MIKIIARVNKVYENNKHFLKASLFVAELFRFDDGWSGFSTPTAISIYIAIIPTRRMVIPVRSSSANDSSDVAQRSGSDGPRLELHAA